MLAGLLFVGAAASAANWQPSFQDEPAEIDPVGMMAPELQATEWFNHIGQMPSLESLKGKVWIVEKWATW